MLLENLVTRRVSEENASNSSLTRRASKHGHLLLAALGNLRFTLVFTLYTFKTIANLRRASRFSFPTVSIVASVSLLTNRIAVPQSFRNTAMHPTNQAESQINGWVHRNSRVWRHHVGDRRLRHLLADAAV